MPVEHRPHSDIRDEMLLFWITGDCPDVVPLVTHTKYESYSLTRV